MKNALSYFYNINNVNIIKKNNIYTFYYKNKKYQLISTIKPLKDIYLIYKVLNDNNYTDYYYKFIYNKYNRIVTVINNNYYILLKTNDKSELKELIIKNNNIIKNSNDLKKNSWVDLWSRKIDNFEYQCLHLKYKYKILYDSIEYFIGMAETAISYLVNNGNIYNDLYISHERIVDSVEEYLNPLNLIIDYKSRDIAEYLKMVFFTKSNYYEEASYILNNIVLKYNEYILLVARLIYPSYFFDKYEEIVGERAKEKEIIKIISYNTKYLKYLKYILNKIRIKANIPTIDWL